MRLILNEKEILDRSLNDGHMDYDKPTNTFRLLAKHYLSKGMSKRQTYDSIDVFLKRNFKGYNSVDWMKSVKRQINNVYKDNDLGFLNIEEIKISKSELETIKAIGILRLEKLAFVLLVYAKIYNQINNTDKNWVNEQHKYIFSDAKIGITIDEQCKMIHKLKGLGLLEVSVMVDNTNIKVLFADNGETAIIIRDFRNFVYEYLRYFEPDKYMDCEECGLLINYKVNRKYCNACSKRIWMVQHREINRDHMQKKRTVDKNSKT